MTPKNHHYGPKKVTPLPRMRQSGQNCRIEIGSTRLRSAHNARHVSLRSATRCEALVNSLYRQRHDEIVKSIHLHMARKYGFTRNRRISAHKIETTITNKFATIKSDTHIMTHTRTQHTKPDIYTTAQKYLLTTKKNVFSSKVF